MKLKYILIIFILTVTVLCFTKYRNMLFTKAIKIKELFTEEENKQEETKNTKEGKEEEEDSKKKNSKTIKSYPVSGNISSTTNNRLTSTGNNTIDDSRFNKIKHILHLVALRGRKQIIIKSLSNNDVNYTEPIRFNLKNLPMKQKKVFANEMKPIMDYILNQINSTKIKNDESYHKLRLIQLQDNDMTRQETKEEVKYDLSFICKYYSNFFNNKKNKKISKIEDLILSCQIIGKKEYLDDVFITSLKAGKNVKLIINQLEITGIHSNDNFLSGYEGSYSNYKLLDNFNTNKERQLEIKDPIRLAIDDHDDHNYINLQNYDQDKKTMVKINSNYKEKQDVIVKEKSYLDSIESLLPDSYKEAGANYLLTEESEELNNPQQQNINRALALAQEEEEDYEIDSVNLTTEEQAIGIKPAGIVLN
jgi:hypothetical protein